MSTNEPSVPGVEGLIEQGEALRRLSAPATRATRAHHDRVFYSRMAVAMLVTALAGFGPRIASKTMSDAPSTLGPILHAHGLAFMSWLVLLVVQTRLVAAHRTDLHRRLGIGGAVLAAAMVPLGIAVAIVAARQGTTPGQDPAQLILFQITTVLAFGVLIGMAIAKRRKPEIHRRLMMLATISILPPAIARMPLVDMRPVVALVLSTLFVVAAGIHDRRTRGRVHPIYKFGGIVLLLSGPVRFALSHTAAWQAVARALLGS